MQAVAHAKCSGGGTPEFICDEENSDVALN
jgi:hypothetical protein